MADENAKRPVQRPDESTTERPKSQRIEKGIRKPNRHTVVSDTFMPPAPKPTKLNEKK